MLTLLGLDHCACRTGYGGTKKFKACPESMVLFGGILLDSSKISLVAESRGEYVIILYWDMQVLD